jgi:hypothetical protein
VLRNAPSVIDHFEECGRLEKVDKQPVPQSNVMESISVCSVKIEAYMTIC